MPRNENWQQDMDGAAEKAGEELKSTLDGMTPEQRQGADAVVKWLDKHTNEAGYKRLCRVLRATLKA